MTISQITNMLLKWTHTSAVKMTNHEEGAIARIIYDALNINWPTTNTDMSMDQDPPIDVIDVDVSTNDNNVICINDGD